MHVANGVLSQRGEADGGEEPPERHRRDFFQRQAKPDPVDDAGTLLSSRTLHLISGKGGGEPGQVVKKKGPKKGKGAAAGAQD